MTASKRSFDVPELMQRARSGDRSAQAELFEGVHHRLLDRIRLMMGPEARRLAESSDFLQGVFAEALVSLDGIPAKTEDDLLRWLTAAARNNIRDDVRRRREKAFSSLSRSLSGSVSPSADTPAPDSEAEWRDELFDLAEALEGIDEKHRRIIELRYLEDLRFAEIAERLDCSTDAARMLLNRALLKVGRLLRK